MESEVQEQKPTHPVFKVTTLSKYLAMVLFILIPFVGGYIGYVYAPEKVVEVEKIHVQVAGTQTSSDKRSEWYTSNNFSRLGPVFSDRTIAMDIGVYSDKILVFKVSSQEPVDDSLVLIDYLNFDKSTGLISLKDYWGKDFDVKLLHLYQLPDEQNLEAYLENILMGNIESEESYMEYLRGGLRKTLNENELNSLDLRSFCHLTGGIQEGWVGLSFDEKKYGKIEELDFGPSNPCGPEYTVLEGILVRNYAQHMDATEPQVQPGFYLDENTSYTDSKTGEKVYKYRFENSMSE